MTRTQYRQARRLIRDNGHYALNWIPLAYREQMSRVLSAGAEIDPLQLRADLIANTDRWFYSLTARQ